MSCPALRMCVRVPSHLRTSNSWLFEMVSVAVETADQGMASTTDGSDALRCSLIRTLEPEQSGGPHKTHESSVGGETAGNAIRSARASNRAAWAFEQETTVAGLFPRVIHEPTPSLLAGRHRGVRESKGDLLVFIDDDVEVSPGWLPSIRRAFEDPQVALVGGPSYPKFATRPPDWLKHFWYEENGIKACPYLSLLDGGDRRMRIRPDSSMGLEFFRSPQCFA